METLANPNQIPPGLVWDLIVREHAEPGKTAADICRRYGVDPSVQTSRDFLKVDFELRREYLKYEALMRMQANLDELQEAARMSDKPSVKLEYHAVISKLAGYSDKPDASNAPTQGFVLNINIPGAEPLRMAPVTIEHEDKPEELSVVSDPAPAVLSEDTQDINDPDVSNILSFLREEPATREFNKDQLSVNADVTE